MDAIAYLTRYDAVLCKTCALNTDNLVEGGRRFLLGLTAVPITEVLEVWPDACCEECKQPFSLSVASR